MTELRWLFDHGARTVANDMRWVLEGKGRAYRAYDGRLVRVQDGKVLRLTDVSRATARHRMPQGAVQAWEDKNAAYIWAPEVEPDVQEILASRGDGIYTVCGPEINGNPYRLKALAALSLKAMPIDSLSGRELSVTDICATVDEADCFAVLWERKDAPDAPWAVVSREDGGLNWLKRYSDGQKH